jgi:ABC-2 type transport system ATP-binding protein
MLAIDTRALRKEFGDLVAVNDVALQVDEGENFALLGPNGAGKSTLIRLLTTLLMPTSGTAVVAGHDVREDPDAVRRVIGVVPQASTSDPKLTAAENIDFSAKLYGVAHGQRRTLVHELLRSVDLLAWRDKLVGTFSMGMRRRLEIARSLVHRPRLLFLDEPTTGLDPASRLALWEMLRRMKAQGQLTLFLTTHYMEEADQVCEKIAIFDHGRIVAHGTSARLKSLLPAAETIEVTFGESPPTWAETVGGLPGVETVQVHDGTCRIHSRDRAGTLAALVRSAEKEQVAISALSLRGNTLEDVFIHFTGRELRDETGTLRLDKRLLHGA